MKVLIILILLLDQTSSDYDLLVAQLPKDSNLNKVDKITQTYTHTRTHTHTHTHKHTHTHTHTQIYSRMGTPKSPPSPYLKSVIYIWQRWKLAQLYFTWKNPNIQKIFKSRDSCWYQHFSTRNQQLLLYQEIQMQTAF